MTSRHITRDYSAHRKNIIRPYDEFSKLEIFSFDPKYTKLYLAEDKTLEYGENHELTNWKSWTCYRSKDQTNDMVFSINYNVIESGEYRIDLVYEQSNHIYKDTKKNTGDDLVGHLTITNGSDFKVHDDDYLFDGENNITKRITVFQALNKDSHKIKVNIPPNCYFMGLIIRKIVHFIGDNYYGANLGSEKGDLAVTSVTTTNSDMLKPKEITATILYDDKLECDLSPSGFFIDYRDEVNFYVKDNNGDIQQIFGGYVSSILPDSDRTKLTLACADRLQDGENKYILDEMALQGGTKDQSSDDYTDGMTKNFTSYPQALKYLCDCYEVTLNSNISKDYTVDGEKYSDGFSITFGSNKNVKTIKATNGYATPSKNYIMLRNHSSGEKKQVWDLYNASDYSKLPIDITNYGKLHITYGLGAKKTEYKTKTTETVDVSDTTAGSQKFSKCGVSADGKYIMAIGKKSAPKDTKSGWTKKIFENKCPHCGKASLVWGIFWAGNESSNWGTFNCTGKKEGGSAEGHIFCKSCDADYSVQGHEHIKKKAKTLKGVSGIVSSSKSEAYKLKQGKMKAVPSSSVEVTPQEVLDAIGKTCKKYKYKRYGSSTASAMKKSGSGDCWAFSELILSEFKKYNVNARIYQYATNSSDRHRSVRYLDSNKKYVDFPYKDQGLDKNLYATSGISKGTIVDQNKTGSNISKAQSVSNTTKTETTTVTNTKGYDKDKPFQAYLLINYSLEQSFKAKTYNLGVKFTLSAPIDHSINTGFNAYWVNNAVKQSTLKVDIAEFIKTVRGENVNIYLQSIKFITPKQVATEDDKDIDWYKSDDSTNDNSSCKINLYQITFNNNSETEPSELNSCGKSINAVMKQLVGDGGYYVNMTYGLHRKDDRINFRVVNQTEESFTATEGDNNNILSWNSISYSPIGSMYNLSMQVFKSFDNLYYYMDTREPTSIMEYGEQCTLATSSEAIGKSEAYYNATHSDKFNPVQTYNFTITVPNMPNLRIGDLVKVVANAKKLNTIKEVKSIKVTFDTSKMPRIQTEIGLGELAPDIQLKENIRTLRQNAKEETVAFSKSAIPINDPIYYEWDK